MHGRTRTNLLDFRKLQNFYKEKPPTIGAPMALPATSETGVS